MQGITEVLCYGTAVLVEPRLGSCTVAAAFSQVNSWVTPEKFL